MQCLHIHLNFTLIYPCINHRRSNFCVPQHFTNGFYWHTFIKVTVVAKVCLALWNVSNLPTLERPAIILRFRFVSWLQMRGKAVPLTIADSSCRFFSKISKLLDSMSIHHGALLSLAPVDICLSLSLSNRGAAAEVTHTHTHNSVISSFLRSVAGMHVS